MDQVISLARASFDVAWEALIWVLASGSAVLTPLLSVSAAVLLPALLGLLVFLAGVLTFLWWLRGKMVKLGEGPHPTAFTSRCALATEAAVGVADSAEIESALYLPAVTIAERLRTGIWSSRDVCQLYIEQVSSVKCGCWTLLFTLFSRTVGRIKSRG